VLLKGSEEWLALHGDIRLINKFIENVLHRVTHASVTLLLGFFFQILDDVRRPTLRDRW
jgi:hypothetical protein